MKTLVSAVAILAVLSTRLAGVGGGQAPPEAPRYRHAYYLFLAQPGEGCEACYIPLLLTSMRLDEWAREQRMDTCLVTTYERDSIVRIERALPMTPADVAIAERHLQVRGRTYRYQELPASEVLRLLEHPDGTIPIHRTIEMRVPSREELADLIASFRPAK